MKHQTLKYLLTLAALLMVMTGCGKKSTDAVTLKEGEYLVYVLSQDGYALLPVKKQIAASEPEEMARLLFQAFFDKPDKPNTIALPEKLVLRQVSVADGILTLNLSEDYSKMSEQQELLVRSALVRSMCQLPMVNAVTLLVEGKGLVGADGTLLENMKAEEYVLTLNEEVVHKKVTLYFTDASGQYLLEEVRELNCRNDQLLAEQILDALVEGPKTSGRYAVLPEKLAALRVWVREGVCYVNLPQEFLKTKLAVRDIIPIYAIVNSLSELSYVNKVQLLINGDTNYVFRDSIDLKQLFERNLDIITKYEE